MKQYLTDEQTNRLIKLGFKKPTMKNIFDEHGEINEEWYSIGELLEFLPNVLVNSEHDYLVLNMYFDTINWVVSYEDLGDIVYGRSTAALIDAIYELIILLKNIKII